MDNALTVLLNLHHLAAMYPCDYLDFWDTYYLQLLRFMYNIEYRGPFQERR